MTNLEHILLGLLGEKASYGYEIEQIIEERNIRDWADIGFSSIYNALNKMEKDGLLTSERQPSEGRGPGKKVYALTPAGQTALQQATLDTLHMPHGAASPFLIGLANLPVVPKKEALAALRGYTAQLRAIDTQVRARRKALPPNTPLHVSAMFEYSEITLAAEMAWLDSFIQRLEAQG